MNTVLEKVAPLTAIAEYSETAAALAELRQKYANAVFDVGSREGMHSAVKARAEVKGYRVALEKKRVELKAPALERSRLIDAEAKRITAELEALEIPIDSLIKAEETRKEREKAEREAAEAARVARINSNIADLNDIAPSMVGKPSDDIAEALAKLKESTVEEWAQEYLPQATEAKRRAEEALAQLLAGAMAQEKAAEAAAAQAKAEREELQRLRAEQAQREANEAARQAEERKRLEKEQTAARAKMEAEAEASRKLIAEQEKQARIAREKEEKEQAEKRAKLEAERLAQEEKARELKRQADELMDAELMLRTFKKRYSGLAQFADVIKAIDAHLKGSKK